MPSNSQSIFTRSTQKFGLKKIWDFEKLTFWPQARGKSDRHDLIMLICETDASAKNNRSSTKDKYDSKGPPLDACSGFHLPVVTIFWIFKQVALSKGQIYKAIWDPPSAIPMLVSPSLSSIHSIAGGRMHLWCIPLICQSSYWVCPTSYQVSQIKLYSSLSYTFFRSILTIIPPFFPFFPFKQWIIS